MTLVFISENNTPNYLALSSDISAGKIAGATLVGGTVLLTDTNAWKIIGGDSSLSDYTLPVSGGGGGVTQFKQLTDVPSSYVGQARKLVSVNSAENALEYAETIQDRSWVRGSTANAKDDEFNNGSIDASWSRVDNPGNAGLATWAESGDSLSLLLNGGDAAAELHAYVKPYAMQVGDYIQCKMTGGGAVSNFPNAGLIIANGNTYGSGSQAFFNYFLSAAAVNELSCSEWSGFNNRVDFIGSASPYFGLSMHMRLKYSAANTFEYYYSPDGISWILSTSRTITMTPSHIGIAGSTYSGSTPFIFSFDYFRLNP